MNPIRTLSHLALLWPVLCSAQQPTSVVATLQLPNTIFSTTPRPTAFDGFVSTSSVNGSTVTAYTISCGDFSFCQSITGYGQYLEFTAATDSTTYNLLTNGVIVCGVTDNGPTFSGTALCTATAIPPEYYGEPGTSTRVFSDSSSYAIHFPTMDEDLAYSLGATTATYSPSPASASGSASSPASAAATTTVSPTETPIPSAGSSTSSTTSAPSTSTLTSSSTSASIAQAAQTTSSSPTNSATGSHRFTRQGKIGVGVGIVAFVLMCCAAAFVLTSYRRKRRAANPNPSELYFSTDEKGQASGT